ncbi:MAG: family 10 glycosylhydrolase [Bacteroidales bacterium]|nr:family 10 glycosylhydrolase [Bacteroidales bacterium]
MKRILLAAVVLAMVLDTCAQTHDEWEEPVFPLREVRAVWVATIKGLDWPRTKATDAYSIDRQKRELTTLLDQLQFANINAIVLQTRVRGTVIYPSDIEPWDECLTGRYGSDPGYDPLAFAVEECHRRGMELHAWIVSIPLGTVQKQRAFGQESITRRHPELCKQTGQDFFMKPAEAGTADYIASLCREIASKYDIDGISLDYIRYPEYTYGYKDGCTASEKRENITRIVRRVHEEVKAVKPWVKLSSSPIGKYADLSRYSAGGWNCYNGVYQDPQAWLREGIQDMLFPMMYFQGNNFYPFLYDWLEHAYGHPVAPGLGIYFLDPHEGRWTLDEVRAQMHTARNSGIGGMIFYRSDFLTRNCKGIYNTVCKEFFPYPALMPRMTWQGDTLPPAPPRNLLRLGNFLMWEKTYGQNVTYNLYGSDTWPVDTGRAENLLRIGLRDTVLMLEGRLAERRYVAVCAMDRFGNQSDAVQEKVMESRPDWRNAWNPLSRIGDNGKRMDDRSKWFKSSKWKRLKSVPNKNLKKPRFFL